MEEMNGTSKSTKFAGIINEKTFFTEPTALTKALDEFCPANPTPEDGEAFTERLIYAKKLLVELHSLIRINSMHIYLDVPIITSQLEDIVWNDRTVEVLYPFKRAPNCKVIHHSPGYSKILIHEDQQQEKLSEYTRDPFENMKSESNSKLVSPVTLTNSLFKLLCKGVEQLSTQYKRNMSVEELKIDAENKNCIVLTLMLSRFFLKINSLKCEEHKEEVNNIERVVKDEETCDRTLHASVSSTSEKQQASNEFQQVDEDEINVNNLTRESNEDGQSVLHEEEVEELQDDFNKNVPNDIAQIFIMQVIDQSAYNISNSNGITIKFRLTPATSTPDPTVLLVGRHYQFDRIPQQLDLWRFSYSLKEALILQRVFAADRFLRLRVTSGLALLCASEPELRFLNYHHARQCLFYMLESEVDAVSRWQRLDLDVCLRQLLAVMRNAVLQRSLHFYFIKDLEMLHGSDRSDLVNFTNAACRISLLYKSPNLLTRVVQRLVTTKNVKRLQKNI